MLFSEYLVYGVHDLVRSNTTASNGTAFVQTVYDCRWGVAAYDVHAVDAVHLCEQYFKCVMLIRFYCMKSNMTN